LVPWIEAHDEHAEVHLRLFEQARTLLEEKGPGTAVCDEALADWLELADRLERWRYHLLKQDPDLFQPTGQQLVDTLDEWTGRLAGREPREPKRARAALARSSDSADTDSFSPRAIQDWLHSEDSRDELSRRATELTRSHFSTRAQGGESRRTVFLYAPLYLSNHCVNFCDYCWFRYPQKLDRTHLSLSEVMRQAEILRTRGMRHLLLVAGDYPKLVTTDYLAEIARALTERGFMVAVEIAPQGTASYRQLVEAGVRGVTLYQETYDESDYARYHARGTKGAFDWRLEGLDRAAEAGMTQLGMGFLLGLGDPVEELAAVVRHGHYLHARFPEARLSFGLPRLHEAPAGFQIPHRLDDQTFSAFYNLLRLAFPESHLVLSTRELPELRHTLLRQCITQISAGSSTSPGGYSEPDEHTRQAEDAGQSEQFPVSDTRSPEEVVGWLETHDFQVQWELESEGMGLRSGIDSAQLQQLADELEVDAFLNLTGGLSGDAEESS
jgi:2-iminoacetate synthase